MGRWTISLPADLMKRKLSIERLLVRISYP